MTTFNNFLCGTPSSDYIFDEDDYDTQIVKASNFIKDSDYVLIGAGAGMSSAAGAIYGGEWFKENFKEFIDKYGEDNPYMSDMYSAGFYPYTSEEAYWGYWSKQCMLAGINADHTPLHKVLLDMLKNKEIFCLSTNADGQFEKAGLSKEKIFTTQGDYFHIQCAKGCHQKTYDAIKLFKQMDEARRDCLIPHYMVPKCPICGGRMNMNLRIDNYFVEDEDWHLAQRRFAQFLDTALKSKKKFCLLEVGVGFNTPTIIRFPFERLVKKYDNCYLVRLNLNEAVIPSSIKDKCVGINADMAKSINDLSNNMK